MKRDPYKESASEIISKLLDVPVDEIFKKLKHGDRSRGQGDLFLHCGFLVKRCNGEYTAEEIAQAIVEVLNYSFQFRK